MCICLATSARLGFAETKSGGEKKASAASADAKAIALEGANAANTTTLEGDADSAPAGAPRGGSGACCNPFAGTCSIVPTEQICLDFLGVWQGAGTSCTPNPCIQPIDCVSVSPNGTFVTILPEFQGQIDLSPSSENNNNVATEYFRTGNGYTYVTDIRWWGVYSLGSNACTPNSTDFRIRIYDDAAGFGGGPTTPSPRVTCENIVTITPLMTNLTVGTRPVMEFTATIPQCAIGLDGWLEIQALNDGSNCIFNWASGDNPFSLDGNTSLLNGTQVNWDLSICMASSNPNPPTGACCDDNTGTCTEGEFIFSCTGTSQRFAADMTCANVTPPCGQVTGGCCATFTDGGGAFEEGDCMVLTAADCAVAFGGGGVWQGAFTDCTPNPCQGACCLSDGTCVEATENECFGLGGQHFDNGTTCATTACPGTGRCCFNAGTECVIVTEAACINTFGGSFTAGLSCQVACPIPPTNDECDSALTIVCGTNITVDNTTATENPSDPLFSCHAGGPDTGFGTIWFSFVATDTTAFVQTCNSEVGDTLLAVYDGSCGGLVEIACSEDDCGSGPGFLSELCAENLIIGNTYIIQAATFGDAGRGAITVEVDCPCPSGACCSDAGCQVLTPQTCAASGGAYLGDDLPCDVNSCDGACCFADGTCTDLSSGDCALQGGFFEGVGTFCANTVCPIRPTNESCDNQIVLNPATDLPYSQVLGFEFASADGPVGSCDGFGPGPGALMQNDLWWEITPTENCQLRVTVTPAPGFDPIIVVRDSCIPGTELACADETVLGEVEQLEFILTAGLTYHIQIGDTGVAAGGADATVEILCGQVGSCCLPDNRCVVNQDADCAALGGSFGGPDTDCGFRGACCLPNTCIATSRDCCLAGGGSYVGDGTSCGDVSGMPDTYDSGAITLPITDNALTTSDINVPDSGTVADVNVAMDITHTFQADLDIDLIHSGITVRVMEDQCGGNDDLSVTFDDEAAGPIVCAQPSVGTFTPLNSLTAFDGVDRAGAWTLNVFDDAGGDTGSLNNWQVIIDGVGESPCDAGSGACCVDTVTCTPNQTVAQCSAVGGTFLGPNSTCSAGACDIRGACCNNITGGCSIESEADCAAGNGTYQGDFSDCSSSPCPIVVGACCNADASCTNNVMFDPCTAAGGSWQGPNTICSTSTGACCFPGSDCRITTQECCEAASGLFQGVGLSCGGDFGSGNVGLPINDNSTTFSDLNIAEAGSITDVNVTIDITHTFLADLDIDLIHSGVTVRVMEDQCGGNNDMIITFDDEADGPIACAEPTVGTFTPLNPLTAFDGIDRAGTWTLSVADDAGADTGVLNSWDLVVRTNSDMNPCQGGTGACCTSETVCLDNQSFDACEAANGLYLGIGSVCTPGVCAITGACCNPITGGCTEISQLECETLGGLYQGNFTLCVTSSCVEVPGACCNSDATCTNNLTFNACTGAGGAWQGPSTACDSITGACCLTGGLCLTTSQDCCLNAGGAYVGDGTNCGEAAGMPVTYDSGFVGLPILDLQTTLSDLTVPDSGTIGDLNLVTNITHTFLGDLEIDLIHNGVTVRVMADQCVSSDNMMITWDDEAPSVIVCAAAGLPTNGTFIPLNPLTPFDGQDKAGTWTLSVFDDQGIDTGTLDTWQLVIDGVGMSPCDSGTGACCLSPTNCVPDQTLQECSAAGGTYLGLGSTCAAGVCDIMGACCNNITGGCTVESEADCIAGNGTYRGDFSNCSTVMCPIILGACCNANATCTPNVTFDACEGAGGSWQGPNSPCSTVVGACCLPGGSLCLVTSQDCCEAAGGSYVGDGSNCGEAAGSPDTYDSGFVGLPIIDMTTTTSDLNVPDSGTIGDVNLTTNITHTFIGDLEIDLIHNGVTVRVMDNQCISSDNLSITWDDEAAGAIVCAAGGLPTNGTFTPFSPLSPFDNMDRAGTWTLSVRDTANLDTGTLDNWQLMIDGVGMNPCDNNPGACCLANETCVDNQTPVECSAQGGTYRGAATMCANVDCTIRGACCNTVDGTCRLVDNGADCNLAGEVYQGDNTTCETVTCPVQRGACCLPDASCVANLTIGECETDNGGVWQGDGSVCSTVTGACCLPTTCVVTSQDCCEAANGTYQGDDSPCGSAAGNPTPYTTTPALPIPALGQVSSTLTVPDSFTIGDVDVEIDISHTWVGDLTVSLTHVNSGASATLVMRPTATGGGFCPDNDLNMTLDDEGTGGSSNSQCIGDFGDLTTYPSSPPSFTPITPLSVFDGLNAAGDWTLTVIDGQAGDAGVINSWTVLIDGIGQSACDMSGCQCPGDVNGDGSIDGLDIHGFNACLLSGAANCECADMNNSGSVTMADVPLFVSVLLNGSGPCQPGGGGICTTCQGDANGDSILDSRDMDEYMNCLINGGSCPCTQGMSISDMVTALLNSTGMCP
ncbi:MAG: proprotein convertase P-domain-containing protein [Phycisphaerales bacterium]|nr:proprotein convertase P-domain-containing protein [Phycisphaerales bacterium]MCB9858046.1 proprotein convertase P-domain-containing protein [Phycisphaerales bacterium]MCB9864143.1 proprotein convertase P-domain-containing protein [Phycisphaerales bacterium]